MAIGNDGSVLKHLRTLYHAGRVGDLTDGQLLERFTTGRGEAAELAFSVLVERHGPMVLRVCRGVLTDPHATQDAFQATFLVLVRKARALWVRDSLGPWLHQVAYRTASCARRAEARRHRHERRAATLTREGRVETGDHLGRALHEEIERLPAHYQAPLVLCDLEGCTHEQAARHLGWPIGTVKSRLSRGRDRLRDRLHRRGLAPSAGLLANVPKPDGPIALVPPELAASTLDIAIRSVHIRTLVPGLAASLAQEVLRSMSLSLGLKAATALLILGATVSGAGLLSQEETTGTEAQVKETRKAPPDGDQPSASEVEVKPGKFRMIVSERGTLEASESADVFCQIGVGATILSILPEGTRVTKGQVVCELDSSPFRIHLEKQRIATHQAEAAYENAKRAREIAEIAAIEYTEGIYKQELEAIHSKTVQVEAALKRAEARLERTRNALQRLKTMMDERGVKTSADIVAELDIADRLDAAEEALAREKMEVEQVQAKKKVLEYTRNKTVKELHSEVEKAKSDELAKRTAWEQEKRKEAELEKDIADCTLLAPGDGPIVYANDPGGRPQIEEGATVRERQKIFSVPDLSRMRVNTKVHESIVDKIRAGQKARIKVDAFPQETLTGVVQEVAPLPDPNSFTKTGAKVKVYTTRVIIEEGLPGVMAQGPGRESSRRNRRVLKGLRPGMTAEVEILTDELDDVITVPDKAVLQADNKDYVAVRIKKPGDGFEWREVVLGKGDATRVEVRQGLQSGEIVILDPRPLSEMFPPARYATKGSEQKPPG